jgi:hypothetical protein
LVFFIRAAYRELAMPEHREAQEAFHKCRERLKAERDGALQIPASGIFPRDVSLGPRVCNRDLQSQRRRFAVLALAARLVARSNREV